MPTNSSGASPKLFRTWAAVAGADVFSPGELLFAPAPSPLSFRPHTKCPCIYAKEGIGLVSVCKGRSLPVEHSVKCFLKASRHDFDEVRPGRIAKQARHRTLKGALPVDCPHSSHDLLHIRELSTAPLMIQLIL